MQRRPGRPGCPPVESGRADGDVAAEFQAAAVVIAVRCARVRERGQRVGDEVVDGQISDARRLRGCLDVGQKRGLALGRTVAVVVGGNVDVGAIDLDGEASKLKPSLLVGALKSAAVSARCPGSWWLRCRPVPRPWRWPRGQAGPARPSLLRLALAISSIAMVSAWFGEEPTWKAFEVKGCSSSRLVPLNSGLLRDGGRSPP